MSYRVTSAFRAFERDYRRDEVLTVSDLECWQPDEARAEMVADLVTRGLLEPMDVADPAAGHPPVWGGVPDPEPDPA